jgi:sec-independent protein translocase protein TatA
MHWVILAVVALLLFGGRGKLSGLMGDAAKGIRAFREGLKGDEATPPATPPAQPLTHVEADKDGAVR